MDAGEQTFVFDSELLIYPTFYPFTQEKSARLQELGLQSDLIRFMPWNLHQPTVFSQKDFFSQKELGQKPYQAACIIKHEETELICVLSTDQSDIAFIELEKLFTRALTEQIGRLTHRRMHPAIQQRDIAVLSPELSVDEQMDKRMQVAFQTLVQSKQLADAIRTQCESGFEKLKEVLEALAQFVAANKGQQQVVELCINYYYYVYDSLKRVRGQFPKWGAAGFVEDISTFEQLSAEIRKMVGILQK